MSKQFTEAETYLNTLPKEMSREQISEAARKLHDIFFPEDKPIFSPPAKEAGEKELRGKILAYGISFANRYFNQLNISDSNEAKKEFIDSILALLTPYIDQLAKEKKK